MGDELRFGIVTAGDAGDVQRLCDALGRQLSRRVVPRVFDTFGAMRAELARSELELAWSPPVAAVQLELAGVVSIAVGIWREGGSSYSSAIFTRASGPVSRVTELRGKRIAWVDEESAAGYLLPKTKLAALGVRSFEKETFEGTHEAVVRAVMEGRADAGATHVSFQPVSDKIETAGWSRGGAYRHEDVRILATAGPIPPDVVVVSRKLPESLHDELSDVLVALGQAPSTRDDVRAVFAGHGFVLVGSYQYDALRSLWRHHG
ncbi:MAG: phosphate/phosphite/phosphonate ABC transporter substrate-binding protein [Deltaproteobacteria bacterium]|nr:phosphate/phosphite/phosphonate ABC transporter substrate-binding protein [Deltaproteobacteria bacterium]